MFCYRSLLQFQLGMMNSLVVFLQSEWLFISDGGAYINTTAYIPYDEPSWHYVALIIQDSSSLMTANVSTYVNGFEILTKSLSMFMLKGEYPDIHLAGSLVESSGFFSEPSQIDSDSPFNGLMQDVGIYSRALTLSEIMMLSNGRESVSGARFLSQCICMPDENVDPVNSQLCENGSYRYLNVVCSYSCVCLSVFNLICGCGYRVLYINPCLCRQSRLLWVSVCLCLSFTNFPAKLYEHLHFK